MSVRIDADIVTEAAASGSGHGFALDVGARALRAAAAHHVLAARSAAAGDAPAVAARIDALGARMSVLDRWAARVATAATRADDDAAVRLRLLELGPWSPLSAATTGIEDLTSRRALASLPMRCATETELARLGDDSTPSALRELAVRERARRIAEHSRQRAARARTLAEDAPAPLVDRLAALVDELLVDRVSPLVDLHVDELERASHLGAAAAGMELLLRHRELTVLDVGAAAPGGSEHRPPPQPTARVAIGDVGSATTIVVVVPGTGSGVVAPRAALADARTLHDELRRAAGDGDTVAVVVELYDAPPDLGRAADPAYAHAAAERLSAWLAELPRDRRVTVVGHSYGALVAARAATLAAARGRAPQVLAVLGAPGVGVGHVRDLGLQDTTVLAARASDDPIVGVADLDEWIALLPPSLRPTVGPFADPLVAHGPDPADEEFGAALLPTDGVHGHNSYLAPGSTTAAHLAAAAVGAAAPRVSGGSPPRRDRRGSAAPG